MKTHLYLAILLFVALISRNLCHFLVIHYYLIILFTAILLRLASNGERVTEIQSVDDSAIVAFCEHDCNSSTTRSSSGTSNILFTGHDNGVIQMWDLATAGKKQ